MISFCLERSQDIKQLHILGKPKIHKIVFAPLFLSITLSLDTFTAGNQSFCVI